MLCHHFPHFTEMFSECLTTKLVYEHFLHSASPSVALQDGDTPLMRAVRNRHELIVRMLLDKGAKVHAYDKVRWVGTGVC